MKTITFYSYKGGVGRSLALVNVATRLAEFGKKVCVIDFDLEAPGLHIKFPIPKNVLKNRKGIVDYVYEFANNGIIHEELKDFVINFQASNYSKPISLISAGETDSSLYWKKLSSINWYDLIYENPNGLAFLLNLKSLIKKEINPDFLLIDSRTGISELSGIALSLLADEVVVVAANNKENLLGAKKIISSLKDSENSILGTNPKINFVLSRVPFTNKQEDRVREQFLTNKIKREYLHPHVDEINIIHSDRELEVSEKVKIAYEKDESNPQISIDYLKLFEKLTKNDLSEEEVLRFKNIRESERLFAFANNTENLQTKLEYLNDAIELNPNNIDLYYNRAYVYFELSEYKNSKTDLSKVLEIYEKHIPSLHLLTVIQNRERNFKEAHKTLEKYLKASPNDIFALLLKVELLSLQGEYLEAEKISNLIIKIDPELSEGYSCRGNCRRVLKKFEEALTDIYKALELDTNNKQAIATLAEIYAEMGRINEFYIQLENVLKLDAEYMRNTLIDEKIYSNFYNESRFLSLLSKYGIYLNFHDNKNGKFGIK